jgi:hypothetical protein
MEAIYSPKRQLELHLHGTKFQKASVSWYRRESIPEDSAFRPHILPYYGEAVQQWFHDNTTAECYHPKEP